MRNDLTPTCCLPFEPQSAQLLLWLPLAVRHKLDSAGLKLTLGQWLALPTATRAALLVRLPAQGFAAEAREAGARQAACVDVGQVDIDETEAAQLLGCCQADAHQWLAGASSFARYAMAKRLGLRKVRSHNITAVDRAPLPSSALK
jgi:hypothetical protein